MSSEEPDGTATPADPAADDTVSFLPVMAEGFEPPTRTREVLHSWPYFLVVVGAPAAVLWYVSVKLNWNPVVMGFALAFTALAIFTYALRFWRGSLLDAEARQWEERQEYHRLIELDPEREFIRASNRFGVRLQWKERVTWEFRPHPMDLITRMFRGIFGTPLGLMATLFYIAASVLAYYGVWPKMTFAGLAAGLALYLACLVMAWRSTPYALTTHRLIAVHGVFKKRFGAIPRIAIMDQNDATTIPGELLAWLRWIESPYNKLVFETPGPVRGNLPEIIGYVPNGSHNITMYAPRRT